MDKSGSIVMKQFSNLDLSKLLASKANQTFKFKMSYLIYSFYKISQNSIMDNKRPSQQKHCFHFDICSHCVLLSLHEKNENQHLFVGHNLMLIIMLVVM